MIIWEPQRGETIVAPGFNMNWTEEEVANRYGETIVAPGFNPG